MRHVKKIIPHVGAALFYFDSNQTVSLLEWSGSVLLYSGTKHYLRVCEHLFAFNIRGVFM
jgi:hypothetical protein